MARLNISLSEKQKRRWKESVDELPDVNNTSDLVRTAVELYMADEPDRGTDSETATLNDAVTDLDNSLDRIGESAPNNNTAISYCPIPTPLTLVS